MPTPTLMLGRGDEAALLRARSGWTDDGEPYNLNALSARVAPAGVGGECIFTGLYLVTRHREAARLLLTPVVDGWELETTELTLQASDPVEPAEQTTVHEIGLSVPIVRGGVERARLRPRGTWFQLKVQTDYDGAEAPASEQAIEGVELEYEIVRESKEAR